VWLNSLSFFCWIVPKNHFFFFLKLSSFLYLK
jgi:hypothetical protein